MNVLTTCALAAMFVLGGGDLREAVRKDKAALQGTWKIVSSESNGKKVPSADLKDIVLIFRNESILVREGGKTEEKFAFLLDPLKKPKEIDLAFVTEAKRGQMDRAIYVLDGDALRICIQQDKDSPRPTDFTTRANSNRSLVILQRTKE